MKKSKKIALRTAIIVALFVLFCGNAFASEVAEPKAFVTKRTSYTYAETVPAWAGSHGNYGSFTINVTVTCDITFNYSTGKITGYSTPMISMSCNKTDRIVSTVAMPSTCSISPNGFVLMVSHLSGANVGYLYYNVAGVSEYEYQVHWFPERTVALTPQ